VGTRKSPPIFPVYTVLKEVIKFGTWMYFGKVDIVNAKEHKGSVIYTINHQNGLMDPIVVGVDIRRQMTFVARADIFKSKFANSFLRSVKTLPIYRKRDNVNTLEKNEETFDEVIDRLAENDTLVIFPEGNQAKKRKIRPLKKGFARMAFQTMEKTDWQTDMKIVPVGINYEDILKVGTKVLVQFGEAIEVRKYKDIYDRDEAEALKEITLELKENLKKICIHIESEEHYDTIDTLRYILRENLIDRYSLSGKKMEKNFTADKKTIAYFDGLLEENETALNPLVEKVKIYNDVLDKYNLKSRHFQESKKGIGSVILKILGFIFLAPIYWFGIITHIVPYKLTGYITKSKVKDPLFHPTVSYSIGTFIYPLCWLLMSIIVWIKFSFWTGLIFLFILPFFGKFSFWLYHKMKEHTAEVRYAGLRKNEEVLQAKEIRNEIIETYSDKI